MKKYTSLLLAVALGMLLFSSTASADANRGGRILSNMIMHAGGCKIFGYRIANTHSKKEWKAIYKAGKMESEVNTICPSMKPLPIIENPEHRQDVLDYLEYYSSDGGSLPKC